MFKSDNWKIFNQEFNKVSGSYRYRWGDCEIMTLYAYIYLKPALINPDLRSKNLYEPQLPNAKIVVSKNIVFIVKVKTFLKYILKFFLNEAEEFIFYLKIQSAKSISQRTNFYSLKILK